MTTIQDIEKLVKRELKYTSDSRWKDGINYLWERLKPHIEKALTSKDSEIEKLKGELTEVLKGISETGKLLVAEQIKNAEAKEKEKQAYRSGQIRGWLGGD